MEEQKPILRVRGMSISFDQYDRGWQRRELTVIHDLRAEIHAGEVVAVVGSSGSGKSLLAHGILGILPYNARMSGQIEYLGEPLDRERLKKLRGEEIFLVPQSVNFLDPLMKVGPQLRRGEKSAATREKSRAVLARYGLDQGVEEMYPFELSGGMARRVLISTAVMGTPKLVIADEPTPGLDVRSARRILGHFREIADAGAGVLLITHDLELALAAADRVLVFYAGTTLEEANAADFEREELLRHPYTQALWRAMPQNGFDWTPGNQPYAGEAVAGCPFAPRCPRRTAECAGEIGYRELRGGFVRCVQAE